MSAIKLAPWKLLHAHCLQGKHGTNPSVLHAAGTWQRIPIMLRTWDPVKRLQSWAVQTPELVRSGKKVMCVTTTPFCWFRVGIL